jgi:hypothetical protein
VRARGSRPFIPPFLRRNDTGECPADQKKPNAREAEDFKEVGVTAKVISSIDVAETPFNI